jgi:hypothetical protein
MSLLRLPLDEGFAMPNSDLPISLFFKTDENQYALAADIMELSNWVDQRSTTVVADNISRRLGRNRPKEQFIKMKLPVPMAPE